MLYHDLQCWVTRFDLPHSKELYYWSKRAVAIFSNPDYMNLNRMLDALSGLHIATTDDDYSYGDALKLLQEQNWYQDILECIEGRGGWNTAYVRDHVQYVIDSVFGDDIQLHNSFIGYLCLVELYNRYRKEVQ